MAESRGDFEVLEQKTRERLTQASVNAFKIDKFYAEYIAVIRADSNWFVSDYSGLGSQLSWSWRRREGFRQHGLLDGPFIFMSREGEPDIQYGRLSRGFPFTDLKEDCMLFYGKKFKESKDRIDLILTRTSTLRQVNRRLAKILPPFSDLSMPKAYKTGVERRSIQIHGEVVHALAEDLSKSLGRYLDVYEELSDLMFEFNMRLPIRYKSFRVRWSRKGLGVMGPTEVEFTIITGISNRLKSTYIAQTLLAYKTKVLGKKAGATPYISAELISGSYMGRHKSRILEMQTKIVSKQEELQQFSRTIVPIVETVILLTGE